MAETDSSLTNGHYPSNGEITETSAGCQAGEQETRAVLTQKSYDGSPLQQKLVLLETCIHCDKRASDQRTLKCGHSFCSGCLSEQKDANTASPTIRCFNCHEVTELPFGGVKELPPNIRVVMFKKIIDRMVVQNEDPRNLTCDWCKSGDTSCYCRKCDTNMCESCRKKHSERGLFANHDVREMEEMKDKLLRKQILKCEHHNQDIAYMCTEAKCLTLQCPACVQFDVCGHMDKISEIKKLLTGDRNAVRRQSIQLKQNIEALEKYYKSATRSQEEIQIAKQKIEEQHQKFLDGLLKKIEEKKNRLMTELEKAEVENQQRQTELHDQWQRFERRASQVEQWQQDVDDNTQDDLLSAITISQLQFKFQSVEGQMVSVQKVFNTLKPFKVNFEPREGETLGDVKVEEDRNICVLPEPIENKNIEFVQNSIYASANMVMERNSIYQSANQVGAEAELRPTAADSRKQRKRREDEVVSSFNLDRKAKNSIAGLVNPKYEDIKVADMSAQPLGEPIELINPKNIKKAAFLDNHRLAVIDSAVDMIYIYNVDEKETLSKRFKEAKGLAALTLFKNKLLAVDDNLQLFVIHPAKLKYQIETLQDIEECTKVGDITTTSDDRIIISQIDPHPLILCLDKSFKILTVWNLMTGDVPSYICCDDQDRLIVVDTKNAVVTINDISDGLAQKRQINELIDPRGVCNADDIIYITHYDPVSGSDWVLKLDNHVSLTWNREKIEKYGKALTVAASEDYFVILAERAIEVFSRRDMFIEDETASTN